MIKTHNKILKKCPLLLTMVLLLLTNRIDAQVTISGKTIAEDGSGIGAIHVLVYQQGGTSIKSFAITKPDGSFSINVNLHGDSLLIKISSINYQNQTQESHFIDCESGKYRQIPLPVVKGAKKT